MKKILSITLIITCAVWMTSIAAIPFASAATIVEGDIVSPDAEYVDADGNTYFPYDVFIIKYMGDKKFKRLVLNPEVFDSYGHLNWADIKVVTVAELEAFSTADAVRADGDDKVYKLFPAGDSGTKRWVETLDCFATNNYDWDSVYVINTTDRDNYTTGSSMCGGGDDVVTGPINLSLASDNPAASTLPNNAQGVTFLSVRITGSGMVNQLTLKRMGAGEVNDFGEIFIYENGVRLTSGRSLSASTSKVSFINLGLQAPTTIQVVADLSTSSNAGNVNYFGIESSSDVTGTGTVGGVFPLNGNPMGTSGAAAGELTITAAGSGSRNVTIGATEVEISQFKIAVATEGANIERIQFFNGGNADATKVTNLKLKDNLGVTVATATAIGADGYVTFVFDSPYYIKKGDNEIFHVFADIGAIKPDRTIILYQELATDLLGIGTTYGFGMKVTHTAFDQIDASSGSGDEGIDITCKGGDITINKIGPNADSIGTDTDDTVFLEFTMSAAADITVKKTRLTFCHDNLGDGFETLNTTLGAGGDIEDIKIVDKDSGTVVVGPVSGSNFGDDGTHTSACPGGVVGAFEEFTDTFDLTAGELKTYQVTADIKIANTDIAGETVLVATDKVMFILYSWPQWIGSSGNVSYMKYANTVDAVAASAIVPSGNIAGEEMTLEAASLVITLAATPSGRDADSDEKVYIAGQSGVEAVGMIFTAGAASDITVNNITVVSYIMDATETSFTAGKESNFVKDTVGTVYLYDDTNGGLIPGSTGKGFTSGNNDEHSDFTGLSWTIPAGEAYTMMIVVDISSAAPASAATADTWISFDIENNADISAVDSDGNSVDAIGNGANGLTTPNTDFGVADFGSLAIDQATDTPDKSIVVMGSIDNEISKFKLTGILEAWRIEKFSIALGDGGGADANDSDNFAGVSLKYQTESQWDSDNWTITGNKTFGAEASLAFSFTDGNEIFVPKDDDSFVTVLVDIEGYNGGNGGKSKKPFRMFDMHGSTDSFKAYGAQSGKRLITYTTDSAADDNFSLHFVARSKPVFAKVAWGGGETELARFSITAIGGDIIFKNTQFDNATIGGSAYFDGSTAPASAYLEFDVIASGTDNASTSFYLYDWTETIVSSVRYAGVYRPGTTEFDAYSNVATIGFHFEELTTAKIIPAGVTKEFHIDIDGADWGEFNHSDEYIYLKLTGDEGGNLATGSPMNRIIIYDDDTNAEGIADQNKDDAERFMMPGGIKNIGPLPITFRTLRGTVAP